MVDPSLCPIPPGFEVIGGFTDDFENFRDITDYDNFNGANIQCWGVSKRWKNSNIRTESIVCGFQFKIGSHVEERWQEDTFTGSQIMLGPFQARRYKFTFS
jgi:hypothetical protein